LAERVIGTVPLGPKNIPVSTFAFSAPRTFVETGRIKTVLKIQ
jgi:hypothetical protein